MAESLLDKDLSSSDKISSGRAHYVRGLVALARGDYASAGKDFGAAESRLATDPRGLRSLLAQQAILKLKTGQPASFEDLLAPALAQIRAESGTSSEEFTKVAAPGGVLLVRQGRLRDAQRLFVEACAWPRATLKPSHPNRVRCEANVVLSSFDDGGVQQLVVLRRMLTDLTSGRDDRLALVASLTNAMHWLEHQRGKGDDLRSFPLLD